MDTTRINPEQICSVTISPSKMKEDDRMLTWKPFEKKTFWKPEQKAGYYWSWFMGGEYYGLQKPCHAKTEYREGDMVFHKAKVTISTSDGEKHLFHFETEADAGKFFAEWSKPEWIKKQ